MQRVTFKIPSDVTLLTAADWSLFHVAVFEALTSNSVSFIFGFL